MHRLTVGEQHNAEVPALQRSNCGPPANTTVRLNHLPFRMPEDMLNPLHLNHRTILTAADHFEVACEFQRPSRSIPLPTCPTSFLAARWSLSVRPIRIARKMEMADRPWCSV